MIVVSDTSPINYLVLIEFQYLLPELFDLVLIPEAVHRELQAGGTPEPVRQFVAAAPGWLEVRSAPDVPAQSHTWIRANGTWSRWRARSTVCRRPTSACRRAC